MTGAEFLPPVLLIAMGALAATSLLHDRWVHYCPKCAHCADIKAKAEREKQQRHDTWQRGKQTAFEQAEQQHEVEHKGFGYKPGDPDTRRCHTPWCGEEQVMDEVGTDEMFAHDDDCTCEVCYPEWGTFSTETAANNPADVAEEQAAKDRALLAALKAIPKIKPNRAQRRAAPAKRERTVEVSLLAFARWQAAGSPDKTIIPKSKRRRKKR